MTRPRVLTWAVRCVLLLSYKESSSWHEWFGWCGTAWRFSGPDVFWD